MRDVPKSGEFYRDYKNRLYQIVAAAERRETGELLVIYQALYEDFRVYAGEPDLFLSGEEYKKYPDAARQYRFERVSLPEHASERTDVLMRGTERAALEPSRTELPGKREADGAGNQEASDAGSPRTEVSGKREAGVFRKPEPAAAEGIDEKLMEFLDTEDYDVRYNILVSMRDSITDTMINNIAVVLDVVIPEGELDDRYEQLKTCLRTRQRYESCRLR